LSGKSDWNFSRLLEFLSNSRFDQTFLMWQY
jgi:hypothetical protein